MIIGGTVKSISDTVGYTFITLDSPGVSIQFQFKSDDERIQQFQFRHAVSIEVNEVLTVNSNDRLAVE